MIQANMAKIGQMVSEEKIFFKSLTDKWTISDGNFTLGLVN